MKFNGLLCLKHQDLCLALIKYLIELAIYISNFAELKSEDIVGSLSLSLFLCRVENFIDIFLWLDL